MHPNRRRKKRPNYGIRTVEVMRGPNGFGFTISGQQPCILSCIVSNSPADQAGLRAGDFLISVNGVSVSKITHDAVVNLIGNSVGPIRMTIAENYYSDSSSDEDLGDLGRAVNSRKPKYMHKPRMQRSNYKHNERLLPDASGKKKVNHGGGGEASGGIITQSSSMPMEEEGGPIEYKAIVGYLGTIEMPKQLPPSSRLQTVCSCIRKLRQEKRAPTTVLMTVLPTCLTLKNSSNHILAIYPTNRVVYISSTTDKDSRYFGLVTSAMCDMRSVEKNSYANVWGGELGEKKCNNNNNNNQLDLAISNSCHVFVTDPKIVEHALHVKKAESFKVSCTTDVVTGNCLEFPRNALYIVSLVQNMYRLQNTEGPGLNDEVVANSPQPSASSNSDSGIGFRDDCGNISDRILVVEFPSHRPLPLISNNNKRPVNVAATSITFESLDVAPLNNNNNNNNNNNGGEHALNNVRCFDFKLGESISDDNKHMSNLNNIRACENICIKNAIEKQSNDADYNGRNQQEELSSRLTVRAMPDPRHLKAREPSPQSSEERSPEYKKSYETVSLHSMGEDYKSSVDNVSMHSSKSFELSNLKAIFKTPSAKFFDSKRSSTKRQMKMVSSCDNLSSDNKYEASVLKYKLSPKVYGLAKPNRSCEELNAALDGAEKFGGFGSLQDLCSWVGRGEKPAVAQSEPDVRLQRERQNSSSDLGCYESAEHKPLDGEDPASWAASFEKLLECPVGLHAFAEFLKKEFSAENIYFWTACERFKRLPPCQEKTNEARRIYQRHLCVGAVEAINVDSRAQQCTEHFLQEPNDTMFDLAQKQIFNLMKFDSYPRFLKSELYKRCVSGDADGPELDSGLSIRPPSATPTKLKKSLSNAEDRRRKSLLPWHRKNRSKSKDRGESEYNQQRQSEPTTTHEDVNDVHSSRSSLTSLDLAITSNQHDQLKGGQHNEDMTAATAMGPLCRVILSNDSTSVVQIRQSETIEQLVSRLLDKRGLTYTMYDVHTDKHQKPLDIREPSMNLAGCEVTVEERVCFKLDLPNRKIISVKSKSTKMLSSVLKQVLSRYDFKLDEVVVSMGGGGGGSEPMDVNIPVTAVINSRLQVQKVRNLPQVVKVGKLTPSLDEITNRVYEDILLEKADSAALLKPKSDKGSVKSEDWGSEHSSGIFGRFMRKDSGGVHDRKKKVPARGKGHSAAGSVEDVNGGDQKKPLIAKWKPGVKLQMACSESDELYEGLSRAQRSRLEDQRGTEINFELPDFLKDKETAGGAAAGRKSNGGAEMTSSRFYAEGVLNVGHSNYENRVITACENNNNNNKMNNHGRQAKVNHLRIHLPNKFHQEQQESTTAKNNNCLDGGGGAAMIDNNIAKSNDSLNSIKSGDPPPLPPKPKIVPCRPSNWGQNGFLKSHRGDSPPRKEQGLHLEQPTSSFV